MTFPKENIKSVQALVIGSGISGLFTAIKLSKSGIRTLLVTKSALDDSNSRYAQGGIAAVLPSNPNDSVDLHVQDTLTAGAGLCNEAATRSILAEGYEAIEDLLHHGVHFDRTRQDELALTREAAHSINRILHAGGDATGHSVEMTLIAKVKADPNIDVIEHCQVVELLTQDNRCIGCRAVDITRQRELLILAPHIVLATGGVGRLYSHTTNPAIATGDGIALANRAGAKLQDMEFLQFHPTAFYAAGGMQFLISEALRGEGGILRNHQGEAFTKTRHPDGELAPRDIVTRFIFDEIQQASVPFVYLDITHLPLETIETRFPTILESCLRFGVDIRTDLIPVAPAAHYLMGGVSVNLQGECTVEGLYAVGESAHTGLHGANRLASNSLLECVVLARRVARCIAEKEAEPDTTRQIPTFKALSPQTYTYEPTPHIEAALERLHTLMWEHVGILRSETGLRQALDKIRHLEQQAGQKQWQHQVPLGVECVNQLQVAGLITEAALARRTSQGAHFRTDDPTNTVQVVARIPQAALPGI